MSVALITEKELNQMTNTLTSNKEILNFVETTEIFEKRSKFSYEDSKETLARALWYGYVANRTAFNLQYQENELINYNMEDSDDQYETLQDGLGRLGFLLYNIATNDGNVFLSDEWSNLLRKVYDKFRVEETQDVPNYIY